MYITALNITENVPGIKVVNMTGQQTGCLHDYQLQNKDMRELEKADVFVINGAGMENFLDKVTKQLPSLKEINASDGFELVDDNSHVWVSIQGCIYQVKKITEGLCKNNPVNAQAYKDNSDKYIEKLEALSQKMQSALKDLPNKKIVTMHEAFPYFANEFSLEIVGVVEREPDSQPNAKELAETINMINDLGVKAVFAEPQYSISAADIIAKETCAKVYSLDPAVTGEDDPNAYLNAMENNLSVLQEALK